MATEELHRLGAGQPAGPIGALIRRLPFALMLGLAGCAAFEGPQVGEDEHTICYSRLATSPDQLHTLAKDACSGSEPRFDKQSTDISVCPLLVPERLYFSCS